MADMKDKAMVREMHKFSYPKHEQKAIQKHDHECDALYFDTWAIYGWPFLWKAR